MFVLVLMNGIGVGLITADDDVEFESILLIVEEDDDDNSKSSEIGDFGVVVVVVGIAGVAVVVGVVGVVGVATGIAVGINVLLVDEVNLVGILILFDVVTIIGVVGVVFVVLLPLLPLPPLLNVFVLLSPVEVFLGEVFVVVNASVEFLIVSKSLALKANNMCKSGISGLL